MHLLGANMLVERWTFHEIAFPNTTLKHGVLWRLGLPGWLCARALPLGMIRITALCNEQEYIEVFRESAALDGFGRVYGPSEGTALDR